MLAAVTAQARLGETREQIAARCGDAGRCLTTNQLPCADVECFWQTDAYEFIVGFTNGVSIIENIIKRDGLFGYRARKEVAEAR